MKGLPCEQCRWTLCRYCNRALFHCDVVMEFAMGQSARWVHFATGREPCRKSIPKLTFLDRVRVAPSVPEHRYLAGLGVDIHRRESWWPDGVPDEIMAIVSRDPYRANRILTKLWPEY